MKRRDLLRTTLFGLSVSFFGLPVYSSELSNEIANADKLLKKNEFAKAREIYKKLRNLSASKNQPNEWKYCTSQIIHCSRKLRDLSLATEEYFQYCRVDSNAPLEQIPIIWSVSSSLIKGTKPDPQSALNTLRQITPTNPNPAAELLAVSILAADRDSSLQNVGFHHLQQLANATESQNNNENKNNTKENETIKTLTNNIALLAGVLLWKRRIPTLRNEKEIAAMKRYLLQIPEPLRAGAFFWYGKAATQIGLLEEAVLALMKIPIHYTEDTTLVIDALEESAKILEKLKRKKQAEQLKNEAKELEKNYTEAGMGGRLRP
ncbi:MAG: hypothetical protein LBH59_01465 [Planctomycetaceae bacterium]|jgi:tetratricopeptide (TPR) repeat protein|nr:hypothetical protein [Planctomycetaceae bacterium]